MSYEPGQASKEREPRWSSLLCLRSTQVTSLYRGTRQGCELFTRVGEVPSPGKNVWRAVLWFVFVPVCWIYIYICVYTYISLILLVVYDIVYMYITSCGCFCLCLPDSGGAWINSSRDAQGQSDSEGVLHPMYWDHWYQQWQWSHHLHDANQDKMIVTNASSVASRNSHVDTLCVYIKLGMYLSLTRDPLIHPYPLAIVFVYTFWQY